VKISNITKNRSSQGSTTEAKQLLPLPQLMQRFNLGDHAKKKARCPFHDDKEPSFSVFQGEGDRWFWKCHAGCGEGDEIDFLEKCLGVTTAQAIEHYLLLAGVGPPSKREHVAKPEPRQNGTAFDWQACVDAVTPQHLESLGNWRWYSRAFCSWLQQNRLIGLYNGCLAFPVQDGDDRIVGAHYRLPQDGSWRYEPKGTKARPFLVGNCQARKTYLFESQWDMLAFLDKVGTDSLDSMFLVATRGAGNGAAVTEFVKHTTFVCVVPQNDEPGQKWFKSIATATSRIQVPERFNDLNDWTKAGARKEEVLQAVQTDSAAVKTLPELLQDTCGFLQRFIRFESDAQPIVIALWIAHCWSITAFDYTPYLHIGSPEKRSGKTQLLECLSYLTPQPWLTLSPSEAVLFRKIDKSQPTLLLDESDTLFAKGASGKDDRREYIRALINSGFRRGATVTRCMGNNFEPQDFKVFCPKAFAGIGTLPDTIADRSIPIRLIRKSRGEMIERLRERYARSLAQPIVDAFKVWSKRENVIQSLRESRPGEIYELSDRQMDISEPLLAIAQMAGGDWPERAHKALVVLCTSENDDNALGTNLLTSSRDVFNRVNDEDGIETEEPLDRIPTKELLDRLVKLETDAPWAHWWEDDLRNGNTRGPAARLAGLLKPFRIKARVIKMPDGSTARGYVRSDFEDAWNRYCPVSRAGSESFRSKKDVTT
jgi:hypothetical protein